MKLSEPLFLSTQEIDKIQKEKKKALGWCVCPLPMLETGQWAHVVNYNETYKCIHCGLEFIVLRGK